MNETRTKNYTLSMPAELRFQLEAHAKFEGRTLSNLINRILSLYVAAHASTVPAEQTAPDRIRIFPVNGAAATAPPVVAAAVTGQSGLPHDGTAAASTTEFGSAQLQPFLGQDGHSAPASE